MMETFIDRPASLADEAPAEWVFAMLDKADGSVLDQLHRP